MSHHRLIGILLTLACFSVVSAQNLKDSVTVYFRQSRIGLDSAYMENREAFKRIRQIVDSLHDRDSDLILLNVKITGAASPEGSVRFNEWLSRERAAGLHDYIERRISLSDSLTSSIPLGRDWRGLRAMVVADRNVPDRDEVIALLDEIIVKYDRGEKESDGNLARLKQLNSGVPYRYLYRNIFPYLRQADVVLTYARPLAELRRVYIAPSADVDLQIDEVAIEEIVIPAPAPKPFYMALKSNMLADALALPEIGAEFYLGKNMSIVGNWMYGWWDNDASHRYWRAYGGDIALRWWFGHAAHLKPLTGHHIGIYGGVLTYDFEFGGKGYMGGRPGHSLWDRCMKYGGIEYGYSLPIARRFNIDFTVGLGYMGGKYVEYEPKGKCYVWEATKKKHWIGPTKLEVSLVWLIGHGNYNKKGAKK